MLLLVGVAVAIAMVLVGLPVNVASADSVWPWGLDLLRRYPWHALSAVLGLAAVWTVLTMRVSWRAEDEARLTMNSSPEAMGAGMEALAVALRNELDNELRARGLSKPIDLPGSLVVGDHATPVKLSEVSAGLGESFQRLVVVGPAGSGKSTALIMLARRVLSGRAPAARAVPVMVNLSNWDPQREALDDAIRRRLGLPTTRRKRRRTAGRVDLVSTRRVLPILDGVDELPDSSWPAARQRLADAFGSPDREFVLACKSEAADEIVPEECVDADGSRVLQLAPVGVESAVAYLHAAADRHRWSPVSEHLRAEPNGSLAVTLSLPLMLQLALVVYGDRERDPANLVDIGATLTVGAIENHLLSHYLESTYPLGTRRAVRVKRWLGYLASMLTRNHSGEFIWWMLPEYLPLFPLSARRPRRLATRIAWSRVLARLGRSLFWVLAGVVAGVSGYLAISLEDLRRPDTLTRARELLVALDWQPIALAASGVLTLAMMWILLNAPSSKVVSENGLCSELAADRRAAVLRGGFAAVVAGSAVFAAVAFGWPNAADLARTLVDPPQLAPLEFALAVPREETRLGWAAVAAASTWAVVLGVYVSATAWFRFRVSWLILALSGRTPLRAVRFLEDAHGQGVLRRNGTAYEFRHRTVQWHLSRPVPHGSVKDIVHRAESLYHNEGGAGAQVAALKLLEELAMYEPDAREALRGMYRDDGARTQPLVPHLWSAFRAIQWWSTAINNGVPDAVVGLSDLYEWLISIQPSKPVGLARVLIVHGAREFWQAHAGESEPVTSALRAAQARHADEATLETLLEKAYNRLAQLERQRSRQPAADHPGGAVDHTSTRAATTTGGDQPRLTTSAENAFRRAFLTHTGDVLHTGALLVALAREDIHGDWDKFWLHAGFPDAERLAQALDQRAEAADMPLVLDDGALWITVSEDLAASVRLAAKAAEYYEMTLIPPGLLALALVTEATTGAARTILTRGDVEHPQLVQAVMDDLLASELAGYQQWAAAQLSTPES
ncbi:NACHT domain-containing protein [Crossiella sp. SN42]|uniref:NACHT domain-containing protein n=1 Tax=Crossiella sp. SN42 TaxID=2944808 RepID=UPI00207D06FA|nr:NACHT domain-containing protein [Crossiella sp. SN42]MCO1575087.1 NACHT domain-containing protein [Crossiella sp. SN42]